VAGDLRKPIWVANLEECESLDGFFCRIKIKRVGMRGA
jgi:hypothetical protein